MRFELTVLGSGSALPLAERFPSAQVLNVQEKHFLIDCGEGAQFQMRRFGVPFQRIRHVFISHLHGDHYLGLMGFLLTLHLLGRDWDLYLYGPPGLEELIRQQLKLTGTRLRFRMHFHAFDHRESEVLIDDKVLSVQSIPLEHRVPCCGFLFREKEKERNMIKEKISEYGIPVHAIQDIKKGDDHVTEDGRVIPCEELTTPPPVPRTYAYCSDTSFREDMVKAVEAVDLLYHEATFTADHAKRARETFHSTAEQAARLAKEADVDKLLLGHFSARYKTLAPFLEEACQIFPNTELAVDGKVIQVPLKQYV